MARNQIVYVILIVMFQTLSNDTLGPNLDMFITCIFAPKIQKNCDIIISKMLMTSSSLSYLPCILTRTLTHLWSVLQFWDVQSLQPLTLSL
jgi:hypothetical protein